MRGELMRYLAELAWAPDAILFNTTLRWRDDGPDRLAVSAGVGETAAEVTLSLDNDGRIAGAFAPDRPRSAKAPILPTPWRGRFTDYRHHGNMWLPFEGEVAWEIDGKETVYWQGQIEGWDASSDGAGSCVGRDQGVGPQRKSLSDDYLCVFRPSASAKPSLFDGGDKSRHRKTAYSLASRPDTRSTRIRKNTCGLLSDTGGATGLRAPGSHQSACLLSNVQAWSRSSLWPIRSGNSS